GYSGFVLSEDQTVLSGSPGFSTTATATSSVAGSPYSITPSIGSLTAANYDFTSFVDGNLTITKAPLTVTADDKTKTYGSSNPALTYAYSGFVLGENSSVISGTPTLNTAANNSSTVAGSPYAITIDVTGLSAANYQFAGVNGNLSVLRALLTVTANDTNREYGAIDPAFTTTITGFVLSEDSTVVAGAASFSTTATATSTVAGSPYTITPSAGT